MIIELFGPPGAGKSTFARALAARMRERGHLAKLRLSDRPSECLPGLNPCGTIAGRDQNAVIRRLRRPVVDILTIARHPLANSRDIKTAVQLVRLLPSANIFGSIRNSQYILRLSHSWHEERCVAQLALFDQAFVQAIYSLALLAGVVDDTSIAKALDCAPKSDLLIRLDAPLDLLRARLHDRRRLQSTIEQLFELDLRTSLASISMIDRLHNLLLQRGRSVLNASSLDQRSLVESVNSIEREVTSRLQSRVQRSAVTMTALAAAACYGRDRDE